MASTKRTPRETWKALEQQRRDDEISRFLAKSPSEVDASLRAAGHDPAAVRAEGVAFAKQLVADRDRLAWQRDAAEGMARARARFERGLSSKYAALPRKDLLERLAQASKGPQPAAAMFRNRKTEEASDDELRAILEEIDAVSRGPEKDE
jgi:hypothetical protein